MKRAGGRRAHRTGSQEPPGLSRAVARHWRRRWDRQQERWIPEREERFDAIVDALGRALGSRFRVLDLGCGTGSLSERVLLRYPSARAVALDFDPILLRIGATGLGDFQGRLSWVEADLRTAGWASRLPDVRFDAAVSTTALHWLTGPQLSRVYHALFRILRPGGIFLDGDQLNYPSNARRFRTWAREDRVDRSRRKAGHGEGWEEWWQAVLSDPTFVLEAALRRERFPHRHGGTPTPNLAGHVRRLRRAGFREVEVLWARWDDRVLAAVR